MNSLFDRLGLYDFFNIIVAGGLVLFYSLEIDSFIVDAASYYFRNTWLFGAVIVGTNNYWFAYGVAGCSGYHNSHRQIS